jgi:hypothetical protein
MSYRFECFDNDGIMKISLEYLLSLHIQNTKTKEGLARSSGVSLLERLNMVLPI